jgi:hypothetical protein
MVGVERFELPTLWSQTRCATRLRYTPSFDGGEIHGSPLPCNSKIKNLFSFCIAPCFLVDNEVFPRNECVCKETNDAVFEDFGNLRLLI